MIDDDKPSHSRMTLGEYKTLTKQGFNSSSTELDDRQRAGMLAFERIAENTNTLFNTSPAFEAVKKSREHWAALTENTAIDSLKELIANQSKFSASQSLGTVLKATKTAALWKPVVNFKSIELPLFGNKINGLLEEIRDIPKRMVANFSETMRQAEAYFKKNWLDMCASQAAYGFKINDDALAKEAAQHLAERLKDDDITDPVAVLHEYGALVFKYSRMELEELEELEQENKKLAEQHDTLLLKAQPFQDAYKHRADVIDKAAFVTYIQTKKVIINTVADLWNIANFPAHLLTYDKATLRKWYRKAMPDIKLKRGNPRIK